MNATEKELEESGESCERWGGYGAGVVVLGVIAEVAIAAFHPPYDSFLEQWGSTVANSLVAFGIAVEVQFGRMGHRRQSELQRRSNDKVSAATKSAGEANERAANATKEAAEARERTAQVEKLTAWRRVSLEQNRQIADAIRSEMTPSLDILIESQYGDPEAYSYAVDIFKIFEAAGVPKVRGGQNMYTGWLKFGLYSAASATTNFSVIADAFKDAGMPLTFNGPDPSRDLPKQGGKPIPALYIFVAPKLPLHFETFASDGDVNKSNSNTAAARESSI